LSKKSTRPFSPVSEPYIQKIVVNFIIIFISNRKHSGTIYKNTSKILKYGCNYNNVVRASSKFIHSLFVSKSLSSTPYLLAWLPAVAYVTLFTPFISYRFAPANIKIFSKK